jgi:NAD(P)H-hydrate epimerase
MTISSLTRSQVRELDRRAIEEFGVPGIVLMENAGRGAAEILLRLGVQGTVAICCGKGNNGGDGFVIARHLDLRNVSVRVHLLVPPDELTGDAAVNCNIVVRSRIPIVSGFETLQDADWIVDALLGTGLSGPVRHPFLGAIEAINQMRKKVLAVDLPSGLDCDTGLPLGAAVRADHTVTFVAPKAGFQNPAARPWLGQIHVADIGAPRALIASYGLRDFP